MLWNKQAMYGYLANWLNGYTYYLAGGIFVVVVLVGMIFYSRKALSEKQKANKKVEEIKKSYKELEEAYIKLQKANSQLDEKYEELKVSEERNKKLAYLDYLTGLPNRTAFTEYLEYELSGLKKEHILSVMYLAVDNFKEITDNLGNSYGEELLLDCAERLKQAIDKNDYLATFGGNEFIILTKNIINMWEYEEKLNHIQEAFTKPFMLSLKEYFVTVSMGIAIAPKDGNQAVVLLKNANTALNKAKGIGKSNICYYEQSLNEQIITKMETQSELHTAIVKDEFELYYQAQVDLDTDSIIGFEALARWNHPVKGLLMPDEFIELAEETSMISEIGHWVLFEACKQLKRWKELGYEDITMAVNLSARQFKDPEIVEMVQSVIDETGICPEDLELEITESIALDDITYSIDTIQRLKEIGIKFSLDDFGTGYSSMNYLKHLPVNNLKLDKNFMASIVENSSDRAIVSAIITLAKTLNLDVIAEGVENNAQVSFLKEAQIHKVQGYLYSAPVSCEDADDLLKVKGKCSKKN